RLRVEHEKRALILRADAYQSRAVGVECRIAHRRNLFLENRTGLALRDVPQTRAREADEKSESAIGAHEPLTIVRRHGVEAVRFVDLREKPGNVFLSSEKLVGSYGLHRAQTVLVRGVKRQAK